MSESNRVSLAAILEATLGTTPASPRMRFSRITGESLVYKPEYQSSAEIRSDRMNAVPVKVGEANTGTVNKEWHYPVDNSTLENFIQSAFFNAFTKTPSRDNDGVAASVITSITVTTEVIVFLTGAAFAVGHLVRSTGFALAANNGVNRVTTGGATSLTCSGATFQTEASPPAAARMKVVGFQGASADITATATGLAATALNFTTLGLTVGGWIKIGGTAAGTRFATAALNDWARITAIAATALTLDNLPTGWTTDAGTGKTINVYFGDYIANGTTTKSLSIERGFLDQAVPTYILQKGMVVDKLTMKVDAKKMVTGTVDFVGMSGVQSTATIAATTTAAPDPTTYPIMAASANVGRVGENGVSLTSPNWVQALDLTLMNNLVEIDAVDSLTPVSIAFGSCDVSVNLTAYFGDNTLLTQVFAGTPVNVNWRITKNSQAMVWGVPTITFTAGAPNATGKNTRVLIPMIGQASFDALTAAHINLSRLEYY